MTTDIITAWHFALSRDRLRYTDAPLVVGEWLPPIADPALCERGYHASRSAMDALSYAPGPWVSRVELRGVVADTHDKLAAAERKHLWIADATEALRAFARWCASQVLHLWDAPQVVRDYLATGDENIRDAARAASRAAGYASRAAAWYAAGDAAGAAWAARAAEWAAEWDVARDVAWDAAEAAARAAARDVAWDAAWAAERQKQNAQLETMLLALAPEVAA